MNFKDWQQVENKPEAAKEMVKFVYQQLNPVQKKLVDCINFEKVEGNWSKKSIGYGEFADDKYQPSLFEAIFVFKIPFVSTKKVFVGGSNKQGQILFNEDMFNEPERARYAMESELRFAINLGWIHTESKEIEEEKEVVVF